MISVAAPFCGLERKTAARVKGKGIEVWSDKQKCRLGQRESCGSVVWWEKTPLGSKEKPPECGLARENRRLGQRGSHRSVVWKEKAMFGSKGKLWECGLERKTAAWVKGKAAEVWSDKKKRRLGQRNFAPKSRTIKK